MKSYATEMVRERRIKKMDIINKPLKSCASYAYRGQLEKMDFYVLKVAIFQYGKDIFLTKKGAVPLMLSEKKKEEKN